MLHVKTALMGSLRQKTLLMFAVQHSANVMYARTQAVLARGLVVAEVYDIMGRVQRLLVRAQATPVRELAASVSQTSAHPLFSCRCTFARMVMLASVLALEMANPTSSNLACY